MKDCKLKTDDFFCECCDEELCQRYKDYHRGRSDVLDEIRNMLKSVADKCEIQIDKEVETIFYGILATIQMEKMNDAIDELRHKR